jgi:hypothetical protein
MHKNAVIHSLTWRKKNTEAYNQYMKCFMTKKRIWKVISMEFLKILL